MPIHARHERDARRKEEEARAPILLVDDRPANLITLEAVLEPLGQKLVRASSGEEALRLLMEGEFALILMDVQMPGLDGIQTAALVKARERSRHIPIIFLTAVHTDRRYVFAGYAHGGVDYLVKPFDDEILRQKVSVFVELYRKETRLREEQERLRLRELELAARRSEDRYRALLDALPQCIWAASADGHIDYVNQVFATYTGANVKGMSVTEPMTVIHADDRELVQAEWASALVSKRPFEMRFRLRRASDEMHRWHSARVIAERDESGALRAWIATASDIHDRVVAEAGRAAALANEQAARNDAEEASRMKDEFLATVSHELRTPLQAILGWTRMLRTGQVSVPKREKALETIERNATAQVELIEDLLDISRIIAGKLRLTPSEFHFAGTIQAAIDSIRPAAEAKQIELTSEIDQTIRITGDPERLQQVVWNLLSNAVKFTDRRGKVHTALVRRGPDVEVSVHDTGRGIAPEFLPRVFDRFRQAEGATTRTQGGLGIGLSIARHVVELHGGSIEVDSDGEGTGSTFCVTLPINLAARDRERATGALRRPALTSSAPPANAATLEGLRVLVVEDEVDAREVLVEVLGQYGATVIAAETADDAIEAMDSTRIDILVSDIGLPNEDGYSLLRRVRARHGSGVPAIAMTGFASRRDVERAREAGFAEHLAKPVDPRHLVGTIVRLTDRVSANAG